MNIFLTLFLTFFKIENRPIVTFIIRGVVASLGIFLGMVIGAKREINFLNILNFKFLILAFILGFFAIGIMEMLDWYKRKEELELERQEKIKNKAENL